MEWHRDPKLGELGARSFRPARDEALLSCSTCIAAEAFTAIYDLIALAHARKSCSAAKIDYVCTHSLGQCRKASSTTPFGTRESKLFGSHKSTRFSQAFGRSLMHRSVDGLYAGGTGSQCASQDDRDFKFVSREALGSLVEKGFSRTYSCWR
jgi:hypothetical protein